MPEETVLEVGVDRVGKRLDIFILEGLGGRAGGESAGASEPRDEVPTRSSLRRWIDNGFVTVDGQRKKAGYALRLGEKVRVVQPPPRPVRLAAEEIPLSIVFEDDHLIVLNKPAGIVVHPGAGNPTGTLANALLHHLRREAADDSIRPGIVHRLDKDTSGLIVAAKNDRIHEALASQFKERQVEKTYLALVYGRVQPPEGRIEKPLGRDSRRRTRMSVRSRKPRQALTEYKVERYFDELTLVEVRLLTGRTHQIRVHFESIGFPIVGDSTYMAGRKKLLRPVSRQVEASAQRQFLHAASLGFSHPVSGEKLALSVPLPPELDALLSRLG